MRRDDLIRLLIEAPGPLPGAELAERLGVSRQVIVQDVALLRATGHSIIATPRGYMIATPNRPRDVVLVRHRHDQTEAELLALVDLGITVVDVIVDHPVYGELRGDLGLSSRADVAAFMKKVSHGAGLLSSLTEGVHYHTLEARGEDTLQWGREALAELGLLFEA